jgi:transcriptional regulator with XRE-family HTH domain
MKSREWLKELRMRSGHTQESFAESLDMPKTTYSSYEQGIRTPSVETSKIIAKALNVPWTIFFDNQVLETYGFSDLKSKQEVS